MGEAVVLPTRDTSRIALESTQRQSTELGESALDGNVSAGFIHEAEGLVEPDRDQRAVMEDQSVRRPRLGFGERPRSGILAITLGTERPPMPRKVAVQVDPVSVLPGSGCDTV